MHAVRGLGVVVSLTLVSACGPEPPGSSPPPAAQVSLQPNASPSASPSPSPPLYKPGLAAPSAAITPSPLPPGVVCRIPYADSTEASGGFIYYPSGDRQADPSSAVTLPGNSPGPGGNFGLTFDFTHGRWVPVPRDWLAPNGQFYVFEDFGAHNIHGVTIADGSSGDVTTDGGWYLIATTDDGVYLGKLGTTPGVAGPVGAWYVQFGGIPNQIVDHGRWPTFAGGALWGFDDSGNLIRHETATGLETQWGKGNQGSWIAGFDLSGSPVVNTGGALAIYHADGTKIVVFTGTNGIFAQGLVFVDARGVWFQAGANLIGAPGSGIFLWTPGNGVQLASANDVHPAGACGP